MHHKILRYMHVIKHSTEKVLLCLVLFCAPTNATCTPPGSSLYCIIYFAHMWHVEMCSEHVNCKKFTWNRIF